VGGVEVAEGQPIALIDDELALAGESVEGAVRSCVGRMLEGRDGAIVTLYSGDGVTPADVESLAQSLRDAYSCDVDVAEGGQPHYPYLIGVE
jgi:dihydroxyacetone kinase-like predicted kinase